MYRVHCLLYTYVLSPCDCTNVVINDHTLVICISYIGYLVICISYIGYVYVQAIYTEKHSTNKPIKHKTIV